MAFTPINSTEIEVGDALKKELFDKIKGNLDDHETRINNFEAGSGKIDIFKFPVSLDSQRSSFNKVYSFIASQPMIVSECYIQIMKKEITSSYDFTGDIEINIRKSTTGSFEDTDLVTIFTTRPSVDLDTDPDYTRSSNQVFDSNNSLNTGDILVLDITAIPTIFNGSSSVSTFFFQSPFTFNFYINCTGEV
jgi:hypothetical protein